MLPAPPRTSFSLTAALVLTGLAILHAPSAVRAQDAWTPTFRNPPSAPKQRPQGPQPPNQPPQAEWREPAAGPYQRPEPIPRSGVEKMDLDPVAAADGSGLPLELWRGLDMKALEGLLAQVDLPPRSPALNGLWRRLLQSSAPPPHPTGSRGNHAADPGPTGRTCPDPDH